MANDSPDTMSIEDMVRERKGDYLSAVADLEKSHKALLASCRELLNCVDSGRDFQEVRRAQKAIEQAEKV